MALTIREYAEPDLPQVMSAWENASKIAHPFLSEAFQAQVRHDIPNLYMPNADTWVADMNGSVIGFIALLGNEVGAIFVEPESQGAGAGKALMDKARGIHGNLELEVFKENPIGRKFYAKYGFKLLEEKTFELTGDAVLRLKFSV